MAWRDCKIAAEQPCIYSKAGASPGWKQTRAPGAAAVSHKYHGNRGPDTPLESRWSGQDDYRYVVTNVPIETREPCRSPKPGRASKDFNRGCLVPGAFAGDAGLWPASGSHPVGCGRAVRARTSSRSRNSPLVWSSRTDRQDTDAPPRLVQRSRLVRACPGREGHLPMESGVRSI